MCTPLRIKTMRRFPCSSVVDMWIVSCLPSAEILYALQTPESFFTRICIPWFLDVKEKPKRVEEMWFANISSLVIEHKSVLSPFRSSIWPPPVISTSRTKNARIKGGIKRNFGGVDGIFPLHKWLISARYAESGKLLRSQLGSYLKFRLEIVQDLPFTVEMLI